MFVTRGLFLEIQEKGPDLFAKAGASTWEGGVKHARVHTARIIAKRVGFASLSVQAIFSGVI